MKLNRNLFCHCVFATIAIALLAGSCIPQRQDSSQSEKLTGGEWRNVSIRVEINSVNGTDSSTVFEADEGNWVQKLGIQPIRTRYEENAIYTSRYYTPGDSLVLERSGTWEVKRDSLYLHETTPDTVTSVSAFTIRNDTARFDMMLDWDRDGRKDDHYIGVHHKTADG